MTPIGDPLDRLAPALAWEANWSDVLDRAGERAPRRRRVVTRRRLIVALAVLVAVLVPLAAVAGDHDWWFLSGEPEPSSSPLVVMQGTWSGRPWHIVAYRSKDGLCNGMVGNLTRLSGASLSCGRFQGVPSQAPGGDPTITENGGYTTGDDGGRGLPNAVFGPVVAAARIVVVRFATGQTVRLRTVAAPASLGPIRFYATPLPQNVKPPDEGTPPLPWEPIQSLTGYDAHGEVVACLVADPTFQGITPLSACR